MLLNWICLISCISLSRVNLLLLCFSVQKKAIGDATPITCRPADLIEPQLEKFKNDPVVQQYKQQDEDVLSYALFPAVATEFFKYREAQQKKVDPAKADTANKAYPV